MFRRTRSPLLAHGSSLARMLLTAAAILCGGFTVRAQGPSEYDVKAVFLFNFAQFVEWPASAFASREAPFVIGILGEDPFGATIDGIVAGETVNGRPLRVNRYRTLADLRDSPCHILFVGKSEMARVGLVHAALEQRAVLTVGETGQFAAGGGVVQFLVVNNKVRLRINMEAARQRGLGVSSKLLRVAELVDDPRTRG